MDANVKFYCENCKLEVIVNLLECTDVMIDTINGQYVIKAECPECDEEVIGHIKTL